MWVHTSASVTPHLHMYTNTHIHTYAHMHIQALVVAYTGHAHAQHCPDDKLNSTAQDTPAKGLVQAALAALMLVK